MCMHTSSDTWKQIGSLLSEVDFMLAISRRRYTAKSTGINFNNTDLIVNGKEMNAGDKRNITKMRL